MREVFLFWLCLEAIGIAVFPLVFAFFSRLPDRGYAFCKVAGLLLVGYLLWITATLGLLPNSRGSTILLVLMLAGASLALAGARRDELKAFLARSRGYILTVEALFIAVFVAGAFLRSYAPDIIWGEKPFELAFLNSIERTHFFPPPDPWLSGENINYYYFGYLQTGILTRLSALGTNTTFFLMLCTLAGLAATAIFGLIYNLVAGAESLRSSQFRSALSRFLLQRRPLLFGLGAVGLLLLVSNLEGVFELLARHGIGSHDFYAWIGISQLPGPYDCTAVPGDCTDWFPTRWWWWWKATRMGSAYDIQEFPFFSFQFGDLHPHVLAMPSLLVTLGAMLHLLLVRDERYDWTWWMRRPWTYLFLGLLLGGTLFTDLWTLPLLAALIAVTALLANGLRQEKPSLTGLALDAAGFTGVLVFLAVLLYLPVYTTTGGGVSGITPVELVIAEARGVPPLETAATRPVHYLIFWLPAIWLPLSLAVAYHLRRGRRVASWMVGAALAPASVALLVWGAWLLFREGVGSAGGTPSGLMGEFDLRWDLFNWFTLLMLVTFLSLSLLALLREVSRPLEERSHLLALALALPVLAFGLGLGAELFFVQDRLGMRLNTMFRFWYQAWLLLTVAGAFALYYLTRGWRLRAGGPRSVLTPAWSLVSACLLGAALTYTVLVVFTRTNAFDTPNRSLDGLAFVERSDPAEYHALLWLNANVQGQPVILEAQGDPYSDYGRISSRTGLPTLLGWASHEYQWRGTYTDITGRPEDIVEIYTTSNNDEAQRLLRSYNVRYVFVGRPERAQFIDQAPAGERAAREQALYKFGQFMDVVFQDGSLRIYRLRETAIITEASAPSAQVLARP